ncbi:DUF4232 domain-containing protein [Streptomyces bugieae]|uniref:DUF4232 domain-containing protein n=1 Tax=Streptomyces bugieae TaxID=3098223 RepID=A0ABU7NY36_9ACTN|nr:DUF4232 domain-containing protein [Streptomyces sp. DSM 41528]
MPQRPDRTSSPRTARAARRGTLRIAAAGLTAVAALGLTACGGQDNPLQTSEAKPFHPAAQGAEDSASRAPRKLPVRESGEAGSGARPDGGAAQQASARRDVPGADGGTDARPAGGTAGHGRRTPDVRHSACDAAAIRIVAKPLQRPVNHLLLVATNTSGATCDLYFAPKLRFDDAQSPLADLPESRPQAVVTLAPGESGYAGVLTSAADGSGRNGGRRTALYVSLPGRDGKGSVGGSAKVALPGGAVYVDDSAWVTNWQSDAGDAAAW